MAVIVLPRNNNYIYVQIFKISQFIVLLIFAIVHCSHFLYTKNTKLCCCWVVVFFGGALLFSYVLSDCHCHVGFENFLFSLIKIIQFWGNLLLLMEIIMGRVCRLGTPLKFHEIQIKIAISVL